MVGSGGEILAMSCNLSRETKIGAWLTFILVEIETYRAGWVLG